MIIAVPVDDQSAPNTVCVSFGRAPYFLIYDIASAANRMVHNSGASGQGGAGIKAAQTVVDGKVEAVLTPRCGENAAEVLRAAGIKMYKTSGDSINENIEAFKKGELQPLQDIHPGLHGQGE
ncbi:MAG: NifB/NifX family molybdenum-iron cluster-binding protein [Syntrophomonas sp.]|nr:NifB/NifX family molybdenum-iron cluster-binding protein [Syntrophomonas sp.]